jgi:hypothetical protein
LRRAYWGRGFADRRDTAILAVFEATASGSGSWPASGDHAYGDLNLYGREIRVFGKGGKPRGRNTIRPPAAAGTAGESHGAEA